MKTLALPSALFSALYLAVQGAANPLPPNAAAILPDTFQLSPLISPPPPTNTYAGAAQTNAHIVRDSYIVVLDDSLEDHDVEQHHAHVHSLHRADERLRALKAQGLGEHEPLHGVKHRFHVGGKKKQRRASKKGQLKGYAGSFSESTVDAIRAMKGVKYVERDSVVHASDLEKNAPWGLARISHRNTLSFGTYNRYEYESQAGEGVDVYVIDTGVNTGHVELEGRAKWGKTIPTDPDQDLNGHGSHVAGTIGSKTYGVAKKATIYAVKVLGAGGSGTMSDVVAGVAWAADAASKQAELKAQGKNPKHKGSVANMSLGGGKSQALDDAVNAAVDDGLHFAVAAGNDNRDACGYSPAAAEGAITVGASTIADERAYFSNHGKCVDIFAPGLNILSIWNSGNRSINTISGTSMASPHIAGLAAYMLGSDWAASAALEEALALEAAREPSFAQALGQFAFGTTGSKLVGKPENHILSPKALKKAMLKIATKGALSDLQAGSPNLLSFNNYTAPTHDAPKRGKWRTDDVVESSMVEAFIEDLKDEIADLKHELAEELEEVTELIHELKESI
ncbi:proteinase B [Rhodotorula kratochvilovae]